MRGSAQRESGRHQESPGKECAAKILERKGNRTQGEMVTGEARM